MNENETPVNSLGTDGIQGINPNCPPFVKGTPFAGCDVFSVDHDTFHKCVRGAKHPQARWRKIVNLDTPTGNAIRDYSYKNPGKSILVHDPRTGEMSYVKRGTRRGKP